MQVKVKRLIEGAQLPVYGTDGAACFDLAASEDKLVPSLCGEVIGTGLAFEIPSEHVMLVFSRSGHGFKDAIRLANCVGVIDSDYRGEVKVKLTNDGIMNKQFFAGDRIAQAMVIPVQQVQFAEVSDLGETARGNGGFGSTGEK